MAVDSDDAPDPMNVRPTPFDKGITLTIKVTAYDDGMVEVDGVPLNATGAAELDGSWLTAVDVITTTLNDFRRRAELRRSEATGDTASAR